LKKQDFLGMELPKRKQEQAKLQKLRQLIREFPSQQLKEADRTQKPDNKQPIPGQQFKKDAD